MMKKQLLKLTLLAFAVFFGSASIQAQNEWTKNAKYKIKADGVDLLMTIDVGAPGFLKWAAEKPGDDESQVWTITDHRVAAAAALSYMEITAEVQGTVLTLGTVAGNVSGKNITLTANVGEPVTDDTAAGYEYDWFQRRKTGTSQGGNDALFIKVPNEGGSRYGIAPVLDAAVEFDGGGIDKLEFVFVEDLPAASVNTFELGAFTIANPIGDQLVIKGATADVSKVSVFSIVGSNVLSQSINVGGGDIELNVNNLPSGLYVVEILGNNGERFTQKLVKN